VTGLTDDEWRKVVQAVETSLPVYDQISEQISFNRAIRARRLALESLQQHKSNWILDVGVGPGTSSRMLLHAGFDHVVGIDPSKFLLEHTNHKLNSPSFHPIRATSEWLPLRNQGMNGVLTCFALRDARNVESSIMEYARILDTNGRLCIVDIGKPDGWFQRELVSIYIHILMPVLSRIFIWGKLQSNPFRMIVPTYDRLSRNHRLVEIAKKFFSSVTLKTMMLGGMILLTADRANQ
jgi:demethylmenaquinone methyltransferase/2-methoxy-6-polyprenyl-1,4-benzoquinol methylase